MPRKLHGGHFHLSGPQPTPGHPSAGGKRGGNNRAGPARRKLAQSFGGEGNSLVADPEAPESSSKRKRTTSTSARLSTLTAAEARATQARIGELGPNRRVLGRGGRRAASSSSSSSSDENSEDEQVKYRKRLALEAAERRRRGEPPNPEQEQEQAASAEKHEHEHELDAADLILQQHAPRAIFLAHMGGKYGRASSNASALFRSPSDAEEEEEDVKPSRPLAGPSFSRATRSSTRSSAPEPRRAKDEVDRKPLLDDLPEQEENRKEEFKKPVLGVACRPQATKGKGKGRARPPPISSDESSSDARPRAPPSPATLASIFRLHPVLHDLPLERARKRRREGRAAAGEEVTAEDFDSDVSSVSEGEMSEGEKGRLKVEERAMRDVVEGQRRRTERARSNREPGYSNPRRN